MKKTRAGRRQSADSLQRKVKENVKEIDDDQKEVMKANINGVDKSHLK